MKSQVLNLEEMQELIKLGIDVSKASMCWNYNDENSYWALVVNFTHSPCLEGEIIPTFTLQDILTILPAYITTNNEKCEYKLNIMPFGEEYVVQYLDTDHVNLPLTTMKDMSLLQACFSMLKWCKNNKYI